MDKLGPYELVEQIDLAGYVWTARKGEGSPAAFVVRFRDSHAAELWAAAEAQEKFAKSGAPGWAPVHEIGPTPKGGAFYATDFYPWSAQLLFEQKDRLTSVRLLRLCDEICAALDGRAHGNLKLSNVLLSSRDLDAAKVFLSDPLASADDPSADRRGVGRIIFELVSGAAFRDYFWPVQTGEKWDALGPDGAKWLDWCNRLLAPPEHATVMELADFRSRIEAIRPKPTMVQRLSVLPWTRIGAAAAFVAVAGAFAAIAWHVHTITLLRNAMLATHQAVHQNYADFKTMADEVDQSVASRPEIESELKHAEILDAASRIDFGLDLMGVTSIDQLPDRQTQAVTKIAGLRRQWLDNAMESLSARHFDNATIDEAFAPRISALKASPDMEASVREAARLAAGMANLAAVWPQPTDPAFRASRIFGRTAVEAIVANPADSDAAVKTFNGDLEKAKAGDPVYTAITDAGEAIEKEHELSRQLAVDLKKLAPPRQADLYDDLAAAAPTPSITGIDRTPAGIEKWKADSVGQIQRTRDNAIAQSLAKARKFAFGSIQPINDGFAAFVDSTRGDNSEAALRKAAAVILGLDQLRSAWPAAWQLPPLSGVADADHARIVNAYQENLAAAERKTVQAITADGNSAARAIAALKQSDTQLQSVAEIEEMRFQNVAAARALLSDRAYPASVDTWKARWDRMNSDLADASQSYADWPDPAPAETKAKVANVLAALASNDIAQLRKFADSAETPALLNAVCVHWPLIHSDDPDADYQIYLDITQGLGQVPASSVKSLGDLWGRRLKQAADAGHADSLWNLAQKMALDKQGPGPAMNYVNDWIGYLQARYPKEKKAAVADFLSRTATYDKWALTAAQQQSVSDFRDRLQFKPQPGTGKLPPNFTRPIPRGDAIYTPPFDPNLTMRFKLMINKAGGSFYLCTTEVPAGWFVDIVGNERAPVFRKLMDVIRPQILMGPSVWSHEGDWIKVNPEWIAPTVFHPWAANFNVDPASAVKPMQYVSPLAAMDAARLIGCRLPTVEEWQLAFNDARRDHEDNTGGPNWQTLRNAISTLQPDLGPASLSFPKFKAELPLDATAAANANVNDVLWFRDVPHDYPTFHDMRGNVAEWVLTNPAPSLVSDEPITVADESGTHTVTNQDDAQLDAFYKHVMRIGLTTFSGSNEDESTPRPPDDPRKNHHHQFFDVGFRPAFDDMPADPEKFIADSVRNQGMLTP